MCKVPPSVPVLRTSLKLTIVFHYSPYVNVIDPIASLPASCSDIIEPFQCHSHFLAAGTVLQAYCVWSLNVYGSLTVVVPRCTETFMSQ